MMNRWLTLVSVALALSFSACRSRQKENGTYVTARDIFGLQAEVLELKDGQYRYWLRGDVGSESPILITGSYYRDQDRILFTGNKNLPPNRIIIQTHARTFLLRDDAEKQWKKDRTIYPFGTLFQVPYPAEEMLPSEKYDQAKWDSLLEKLPALPPL